MQEDIAVRQAPIGTITLLFTDIEGSTRLLQRLGERYAAILARCRAIQRAAYGQWNGYEVDTQGDAFFIAFARASDAVAAAVAAQQALFAEDWGDGVELRVRMGLHTGEPQRVDEGYVGMAVHHAARIMSAAHGGQVLLSQITCGLVGGSLPQGVTLRDMGEHHLKDVVGSSRLFQLVMPGLPATFAPLRTSDPHHLLFHFPPDLTPFVGRGQAIMEVSELLRRADVRLLTLVGTAGVGKTRMAMRVSTEVSGHFPDGVFFVALEQVSDTDGVIQAIAQAVSVQKEEHFSLLARIKDVLRPQRILLLLDNFEQVRGSSKIVTELLAACRSVKVLITSRERLHMQAEHVFDVSPLTLPEAKKRLDPAALLQYESIELFTQRARAVQPSFELTGANASAIVNICTRLDGIPLAIELAAARSRYFPPRVLLSRLEKGLSVLVNGAYDSPTRQQTLRGAIAWSYELLSPAEQQVFRRMAVFVRGGMLEALEQVCTAAGALQDDMLVVLESLADKSLLQQQVQAEGEIRFWQLQTLREYALEYLLRADESDVTRQAHADYYLARAEEGASFVRELDQVLWLDRFELDHDNWRVALEWLLLRAREEPERAEQALRLCIALGAFWEHYGYFSEGASYLERALAVGSETKAQVQAEALHLASFMVLVQDNNARAEELLKKSKELFRKSGDRKGIADILRLQGALAAIRGSYKEARSLFEEALEIYEALGNERKAAFAREDLADVAQSQGNYTHARNLLEGNLSYFQARGESYHRAYSLSRLSHLLFLSYSDRERAQALADESLALFKEVDNKRFVAYVICLQCMLGLYRDEPLDMREQARECVETFKALRDRSGIADALLALARILVRWHEYTEALASCEEAYLLLRAMGAMEASAACLEIAGEACAGQGRLVWAVQLWGTAASVRATIVSPMHRVYRPSYLEAVRKARAFLGEQDFQIAWTRGRDTSLELVKHVQEKV